MIAVIWPFKKKKHFSERGLTPEEQEIWLTGHNAGVDTVIERLGALLERDPGALSESARRLMRNIIVVRQSRDDVSGDPDEAKQVAAAMLAMFAELDQTRDARQAAEKTVESEDD